MIDLYVIDMVGYIYLQSLVNKSMFLSKFLAMQVTLVTWYFVVVGLHLNGRTAFEFLILIKNYVVTSVIELLHKIFLKKELLRKRKPSI